MQITITIHFSISHIPTTTPQTAIKVKRKETKEIEKNMSTKSQKQKQKQNPESILQTAQTRLSSLISTLAPSSSSSSSSTFSALNERAYKFPAFDDLPIVPGQPRGCLWGFFDGESTLGNGNRNGKTGKDQLGGTFLFFSFLSLSFVFRFWDRVIGF